MGFIEFILDPVSETLQRLGFPNLPVNESQTLYTYMNNLFQDVLNNAELGNGSDHIGMFIFYNDNARHLENKTFPELLAIKSAFSKHLFIRNTNIPYF